jgi:cephalosporin-C deacetylase
MNIHFSKYKQTLKAVFMCQFLVNLFNFAPAFAQPIQLSKATWRFQEGDDLAWANPEYTDTEWLRIDVGTTWEAALGNQFDGIAWYRCAVEIPAKMRKSIQKAGGMSLKLGLIDDADETFFNGQKVGSSGKFPPESVSAWSVQRSYFIPADKIVYDQPNLIAVRVADWGGGGGLYSGEYLLEVLSWKEKCQISFKAEADNFSFPLMQPLNFEFQVENNANTPFSGTISCEIQTFSGKSVIEKTQDIKVKRGTDTPAIKFNFDPLESGFYHIHLKLRDQKGYTLKEKFGFAISPENTTSVPNRPADFTEFWQKVRTELDSVAPRFTLKPNEKFSTPKTEVFDVEMYSLGDVRVCGYYACPVGKKNLPAVLHVQGYSSVMEPFGFDENIAQFFLNIRGHGNSRADVNPGFPGYLQEGIAKPETYIYRGAYADCLRAVDFLCSRNAEIDTTRLAVWGASQGGALSIATAALDKRIKFCLPDVPFLSDFRNYFKIASWPAGEFKLHALKNFKSLDEFYAVLDYFDIKNMAPSVSCPVFMGVGLFDDVCPPAINFAAYNSLSSAEKSFKLYTKAGHSLPSEHHNLKMKWLFERFFIQP